MDIVSTLVSQWDIDLEEARQSEKLASVTIMLKYLDTSGFIEIPPEERKAIIRKTLQQQYTRLKKENDLRNIKLAKLKSEPRKLEAQIMLKDLFNLEKKAYILNINIIEIEGVAQKRAETTIKEQPDAYFAIKVRFAILVEGITKGLQAYEDRVILLKAKKSRGGRGKGAQAIYGTGGAIPEQRQKVCLV